MLSAKWCYKLYPDQKVYSIFEVSTPITQRQALYILKKRLKIKTIFDIIVCNEKTKE